MAESRSSLRPLFAVLLTLLAVSARPAEARQVPRQLVEACDGGELPSCSLLGLVYESGAAGVQDLQRAEELYQRACDREVRAGCMRLELVRERIAVAEARDEFTRVGYIADASDGSPIGGALVEVPRFELRVLSDRAGMVDLGRLSRGDFRIEARRGGYQTAVGELPVPWETDFLILMDRDNGEGEPEAGTTTGNVFGRVTVDGTDEPLSHVEVTLVRPDAPLRIVTNADGRFSMTELEPGTVELRFSHLGYEIRTTSVSIRAGRTTEVQASLATQPIELEPIRVSVASRYLERTGFFRRAREGFGTHFTSFDVAERQPDAVSDLLTYVPGVTAQGTRRGVEAVSRRRAGANGNEPCRLQPWVDGMFMADFIVNVVEPGQIEAMEIYQGPQVPIEYMRAPLPGDQAVCGVVLIWTREPR